MEKFLILNYNVLYSIPNITKYITIQNKNCENFHQIRKKVMEITNHTVPVQENVCTVNDIDTFVNSNKSMLTAREIKEIKNYENIYYYGEKAPLKYNFSSQTKEYKICLFEQIAFRYEVWDYLGGGSFGLVLLCFDHKQKQFVAIKVVKYRKKTEKMLLNETQILETIRTETFKNSGLNDIFTKYMKTFSSDGFVYQVFEKLSTDIERLLETYAICPGFVKNMTKTLMEGLCELKKLKIIHLDLKTNNLLLTNDNSNIKICDFGLSTFHSKLKRSAAEAQCLAFRAPEAILGGHLSYSLDMWSAGCIIVEMAIGENFLEGENRGDHLTRIMEVLGRPPLELLQKSKNSSKYFYSSGLPRYCTFKKSNNGNLILTAKKSPSGDNRKLPGTNKLEKLLNTKDTHFIDFLSKCLEWDPTLRLSPEDALKHPYLVHNTSSCNLMGCSKGPLCNSSSLP